MHQAEAVHDSLVSNPHQALPTPKKLGRVRKQRRRGGRGSSVRRGDESVRDIATAPVGISRDEAVSSIEPAVTTVALVVRAPSTVGTPTARPARTVVGVITWDIPSVSAETSFVVPRDPGHVRNQATEPRRSGWHVTADVAMPGSLHLTDWRSAGSGGKSAVINW